MAHREQVGRLMTAEELLALEKPDRGGKHELERGVLRVSEPPGYEHGRLSVVIATRLMSFVRPRKLGTVLVESGYVLERGPDTVYGPDVSFVARDRAPVGEQRFKYVEGYVDLAVEVLSPDDHPGRVARKVARYLDRGTRRVWVVDPRRRTVAVYAPGDAVRILREGETLDGGDVLPGFAYPLTELFGED